MCSKMINTKQLKLHLCVHLSRYQHKLYCSVENCAIISMLDYYLFNLNICADWWVVNLLSALQGLTVSELLRLRASARDKRPKVAIKKFMDEIGWLLLSKWPIDEFICIFDEFLKLVHQSVVKLLRLLRNLYDCQFYFVVTSVRG